MCRFVNVPGKPRLHLNQQHPELADYGDFFFKEQKDYFSPGSLHVCGCLYLCLRMKQQSDIINEHFIALILLLVTIGAFIPACSLTCVCVSAVD